MKKYDITFSCKDFGTYDLVVVGGGCTGVFAAVRAARLGLKVAIVEKNNCFGGVATVGLVNVWHSLYDIYKNEQVIAGLTDEVEQVLTKNNYARVENTDACGIRFDPNALKMVLDKLVTENGVRVFFHTYYNQLLLEEGKIKGVVVCNKDGMGVISADFFIDATGDGDLCRDAGLESYTASTLQPPSPCCFLSESIRGDIGKLILEHGEEFGLDDDWGWSGRVPGLDNIFFRADFHIFGKMCNRADELTMAELEGRRKIYALAELLRKYDDPKHTVVTLGSQIGIRETVHFSTNFKAGEWDLLLGKTYDDTVMRGTYRVDIHHQHDNGITFRYLDGRSETFYGKGTRAVLGNWREEKGITAAPAPYYQVPFSILVQNKVENLIPVGRMINADEGAFGALRVMVNLNQLGEAAGVGAYIALQQGKKIAEVSGAAVVSELKKGGSY